MNYISKNSVVGENTLIGHFVVIDEDVVIGKNCKIGNNVIIHKGTKVGDNIRIDDNSVIGKLPMKSINSAIKNSDNILPAVIGSNTIIGTGVIIYAGCNIGEYVLIADLSTIRENVRIGEKTIIGRGVAVENFCNIGSYCKLETNVYITAYSEIEDYVFIAPGVVTSNDNFASRTKERFKCFKGVTIKRGGRIGAQATLLPGKIINEDAFVAAGSVVTKNVNKNVIVAGNPARYMKDVPEEQLLKNQ
ncbi:MAG: acyltransferase [Bacillota bacterium]|nr:acyltransferase [Bacillota bacterium]